MKRNLRLAAGLVLALMAGSCVQGSAPETSPAQPSASSPSASAPTASAVPTGTPTVLASFAPLPARPDEQVYRDPQGWYAFNFPAAWKSTGRPDSFSGENGFFETGYMPEMMFMQHPEGVCQWLANISSQSLYSVAALTVLSSKASSCTLTTLPGITPASVQAIIENPQADYAQRFFFLKSDAGHFDELTATFAWLRPVDAYRQPAFRSMPLRPAEAPFWENAAPMPAGFSVTEYKLSEEAQNASPSEKIFLQFIPPDAPPLERKTGTAVSGNTPEDVNAKLEPFGYELRPASQAGPSQLYKNGVLVINNIYRKSEIYRLSTPRGERIAFLVYSLKDASLSPYAAHNAAGYLVQNDVVTKWEDGPENPMDPGLAPIWYRDELLWVQATSDAHVQVQNSRRGVLFTFATYFGTRLPVNEFKSWNGHWILEVSNFVVQDGEILNEKFGFEEVFDWRLIDDKPFYFFRKGQRVGISYAGQFLPLYYHDVVHGFCCGLAANNPIGIGNELRFFAKRDGVWYYVIVKVD